MSVLSMKHFIVAVGVICAATLLLSADLQVVPRPTRDPAVRPSTQSGRTPQKVVPKRSIPRVERIMFSLEVRLLSGDINLNQQWGTEKVLYEPERLSFRFRPLTPGAASAEWQVARRPFVPNDRSGEATGLVASGSAGLVPVAGSRVFFVDAADFMPAAPPHPLEKPIVYYVRLVARNENNAYYGAPSKSVRIVYKADPNYTEFTELGLLGAPRIDRVVGPWGLDAGNRPILVAGEPFRIHGRSFPQKPENLKITFPSENKGQARASVEKVTGSENDMIIEAMMYEVSPPGVLDLELAVVDRNTTRYKAKTLVALAGPPRFEIVYKGLRCLEETNEVGSDEPYAVFVSGCFSNQKTLHANFSGPNYDVDQGEYHAGKAILQSNCKLLKGNDAFILAGLMEHDDGDLMYIKRMVAEQYNRESGYGTNNDDDREAVLENSADILADFLERAAIYGNEESWDSDKDDLVDVKPLRLSDALLRECRLSSDAKTIYLDMAGDGGRYRLEFAIKVER